MSNKVQIFKFTFIAFASFLISTMVLSGIYMSYWIDNKGLSGASVETMRAAAESSLSVQLTSGLIGFCGMWLGLQFLVKRKVESPLSLIIAFTCVMFLYSFVSVLVHPEHHGVTHSLKLAMPLLLGAGFYYRHSA